MFRSLKLRSKILLALLLLCLAPLCVTLLVVSKTYEAQQQTDIFLRVNAIANFVERSTSYAQRERGGYVGLMAADVGIVPAFGIESGACIYHFLSIRVYAKACHPGVIQTSSDDSHRPSSHGCVNVNFLAFAAFPV